MRYEILHYICIMVLYGINLYTQEFFYDICDFFVFINFIYFNLLLILLFYFIQLVKILFYFILSSLIAVNEFTKL